MSLGGTALAAAVVGNGLLAGLYLAFACAVGPGLRRVGDRTYVQTVRAINAAILNPVFLVCFVATPLVTVAAVVLHGGDPLVLVGLVGAAGASLVTVVANVPLNERLASAPIRTEAECAAARHGFAGAWNRWNVVRTVLSTGAVVALILA